MTRRGFTIIETLVAIGVVTILIGILVPAIGIVRARARSSENQSNLRQLAIGSTAYGTAFNEWLPPAVLQFSSGAGVITRAWDWEQSPSGWSPGVIWRYVGDGRVFQCPDLERPSGSEGGAGDSGGASGVEPFTGYNYNTTYLGSEGALPGPGPDGLMIEGWANARLGARPGQVRRPESAAFFGEGGWKGGANRFMRAPGNSVEFNLGVVYAGGQAFRRRGFTHVVWLDGHTSVVSQPCEGTLAGGQAWLLTTMMDFPRNGFLSDDDRAYAP